MYWPCLRHMAISKRMVICCLNQITQNLAMEVHSTFCHLLQFCKGNANNLSFKTLKLFDEESTTLLASLPNPPPPSSFPTVIVSLSDFFVSPSFLPALPRPVPPRPALLLPPHRYHHFYHYHHCHNHHPHIKSAPFSSPPLSKCFLQPPPLGSLVVPHFSSSLSFLSSFPFVQLLLPCPFLVFSGGKVQKTENVPKTPSDQKRLIFPKNCHFLRNCPKRRVGRVFFSRLCFLPQIGASRSSSVLLGSPRFSSVLLGSPRFSSVLLGSPRCSPRCSSSVLLGVLLGSPRFSSVLLGSPRFCSVLLGSALFSLVLLGAPRSSSVFSSVLLGVLGAKFAKKHSRLRFSFGNTPRISRLVFFLPRSG